MKTKKFIAFLAAVIITAGAITTGTIILLRQPAKKTAEALTPASLMIDANTTPIPARFLPNSNYTRPYDFYIEFGEYPQTHVADETFVNNLNTYAIPTGHQYLINSSPSIGGSQTWTETLLDEYAFSGEKYVKVITHHGYQNYTMSTGIINRTNNTWFKVEPLLWFVTNYDEVNTGTASTVNLLAVNEIIAGIPFHSNGATTYYNSGIRAFLNGTNAGSPPAVTTVPAFTIDESKSFFQTAFNTIAQSLIASTTIDNINDQTYNAYVDSTDQNTTDKIYLPSYTDMTGYPFFTSYNTDATRKSKPTDFSLANYAYYNSSLVAGYSCLRSAYSSTNVNVWIVGSDGGLIATSPYVAHFGLRPACQILISNLQSIESVSAITREYAASYNYHYDLNGATGIPPTGGVVSMGSTVTLPAVPASRPGYIFSGWGMNNSVTKTHDAGTLAAIAVNNTIIYAIWTPIDYTITYNMGGGVWVPDYTAPADYNMESLVTLPTSANVICNGYVFLRWRDSTTNAIVTTIPSGSTGDKSYYAEWGYTTDDYDNAVSDAYDNGYKAGKAAYPEYGYVYWNILTDSDTAGSLTTYTLHSNRQYNYGEEYILPTDVPLKIYSQQYEYTFAGWSLSRQTSSTIPATVTFPQTHGARDIYYYAAYERKLRVYDINFVIPVVTNGQLNYSDGNTITISVEYGAAVTPTAEVLELLTLRYGDTVNYIFNGWSSTQGGAKIADFTKCTAARTFYARYILQSTV
jgi:uncharacterized repeat protein (TIGR02543 family)